MPPERVEEWRRRGRLTVLPLRLQRDRPLNYAFYEDTLKYNAFDAKLVQPTLVFQGLRDASVDHRTVEEFARGRPNVTLALLDDDHQLTASLPRIWTDVQAFLGLVE